MLQSTARKRNKDKFSGFSVASRLAEEAPGPPAEKRSAWNGNQGLLNHSEFSNMHFCKKTPLL
ncbi:hypothetical protein EKQ44_10790 [Sutcliffiella horikoshii]|nr:hypothetical protein [Sutcliffiella horikoshii]